MDIVAVDIGGTHARFAIAQVAGGGVTLGPETVLRTGDYAGLAEAWTAFAAAAGRPLPPDAGIAVAAPVEGDAIRMTNNRWVLRPARFGEKLGVERFSIVNDFAAVAHAVACCGDGHLHHVCGPDSPLPEQGVISIVGPGTGLGVAILHCGPGGNLVIPTEGGHIGFAPLDAFDEQLLNGLQARFGRVSVERVISGPGLADIHATLHPDAARMTDRELWALALSGEDHAAAASLDRFCGYLGSVSGDFALAHGADAVVLAGGLGLRLAAHLKGSRFAASFVAKGRYRDRMAALPVKLITFPQPGLLGAAAAFAAEHGA